MKFRYLLIVFLFNFFLTNFVFTKKSLAACTANASPTGDCTGNINITSSNLTITNNYTVTGYIDHETAGVSNTIIANNGTISSSTWAFFLYGSSLSSITNSGTISNTSTSNISFAAIQLSNSSATTPTITVNSLTNNSGGTISGNYAILNNQAGTITTITNSGTITGLFSAIDNEKNSISATIGTITNNSGGIISSTNHAGTPGARSDAIFNEGTITTITNSGTIQGNVNSGTVAGSAGIFNTGGTIGTITNNSSGTITSSQIGINNNSGTITTITNEGTISGTGQYGIYNPLNSTITTLTNSGTIQGNIVSGTWYGIDNAGRISTLTNTGTISGSGKAINNTGTITTLNNSAASLMYNGRLPQTYNIILGNNASTFGTLSATNVSTYDGAAGHKTTFGISSGTVKANKYAGVISGVSNSYLDAQTGTYGGYSWSLSLQDGSTTTWDLLFPSYISPSDTDISLSALASHLKGAINYQNSSLNQSLNYDCSYFGKNNFCMSGGVRNTNTRDNDSQSAVLVAAAKINDRLRVGGYIDEVVSDNFNSNMKLSSNIPILGVFAKYNEHGDFGLKASLSAGYVDQDVKSTRTVSGTSEPGSGTSSLDTTGIQAEIKYGISHSSFLTVSPYVGYRNTLTTRDRYTEQTSSSVTTPLTYNKIKQKEETAFAGIELKSHFYTTDSFATLNLGYEHTTKFSVDNLSTAGVSGTSDINLGSSVDKNRPILTASFNKDLNEAGRLSLNFDRRQQAYSPTHSTNVAVQYMVGF
jgi:hypothetical protein